VGVCYYVKFPASYSKHRFSQCFVLLTLKILLTQCHDIVLLTHVVVLVLNPCGSVSVVLNYALI
jgi:hypothetical protein